MRQWWSLGCAVVLTCAACSIQRDALGGGDARAPAGDGGLLDADRTPGDGGDTDAGSPTDAGAELDAGFDAGMPTDAGAVDAGAPDAGPCPDADDDGVCDDDDDCEGSDDGEDADADGVPDGCDPCSLDGPGADPIELPASGSGITITAASLDGGGNVVVVDPGATVQLSIDYEIVDCGCPGCIDQIEIGLVPGSGVSYCAYSAVPGCGGDTGSDTETLTAPSTPGEYWIRFGRGQDYGCHADWWHGTPPADRTLGAICVR